MKKFILAILLIVLNCVCCFASFNNGLSQGISPASLLKSYKDISLRPLSINKLKKQTNNLTEKDNNILLKYIYGAVKGEDTFLLINGYLRNNLSLYISKKDITKPLNMRLKLYSEQLNEVISKGRLPQNTILYYGVDNKTFTTYFNDKSLKGIINQNITEENAKKLKNILTGKSFTEKGFMITSYDKNFTKNTNILLCIKAPKNLQALWIDNDNAQNQKQVIIKKGYTWKITDAKLSYSNKTKKYI